MISDCDVLPNFGFISDHRVIKCVTNVIIIINFVYYISSCDFFGYKVLSLIQFLKWFWSEWRGGGDI